MLQRKFTFGRIYGVSDHLWPDPKRRSGVDAGRPLGRRQLAWMRGGVRNAIELREPSSYGRHVVVKGIGICFLVGKFMLLYLEP
jgi:hypothetical protein